MKQCLLILLLICFLGCSKDKTNNKECNPENPFEMKWMTEWIVDLQNCACTISIFQAEHEGETVFWQLMTDPLCQVVITDIAIHNCVGKEILIIANYNDLIDFQKKVSNMKIIYNCPTPRD